jgi:phospholipid-binding lipoprotein MlaA
VSNVFANLREPITIASNLLLGDAASAGSATARFLINTTAGLGGYYDAATGHGYPHRPRGLEDVLCRYSVPDGPYVVLPILGPATVRGAAGRITTLVILYFALGPIYIPYRITDIAVQYVDLRDQLRYIDSTSIDVYATHKSAHLQTHKLACEQQTEAGSQLFGQ